MIEKPQIVQTAAQATAIIRITIPRAEIRKVMSPARREVVEAVAAQGIAAAGPWFSYHLKMDPEIFDLEVGVPVATPFSPAGRVRASQLPAARVVRTVYRGSYEGLAAAWGEFMAWIKAQGHTPRPDLWEHYAAGPESSPDPAQWRTELNQPLAS